MTQRGNVLRKEKSAGDAAVDGLLSGITAGVVGAVYLLLAGLVTGQSPNTVLARFDPSPAASAMLGGLLHLGTSAVYGALFATIFHFLAGRVYNLHRLAWLLGMVYGLFLWLLAKMIFSTGLDSSLAEVSDIHFLIFHLIYGLVLGALIGRSSTRNREI